MDADRITTQPLNEYKACEEEGCEVCQKYHDIFMRRIGVNDQDGTWHAPDDTSFHEIDTGTIIFGDIEKMGWVVVKNKWPDDDVGFQAEMAKLRISEC